MIPKDLSARICEVVARMKTQNNHCTSHPVFVVQQRRRMYGFSPDYSDNVVWLDNYNDSAEAGPEEAKRLESDYDETGIEPDGWTRTSYVDVWEHVTTCFTEHSAQAYVKRNGHNLEHPRVYVESAWRNQEWQDVVQWLTVSAPELAVQAIQERGE